MFKKLCVVVLLLVVQKTSAQLPALKNGDLLFQNLDCGPLCDAIEEVTRGYNDGSFSHIGLVCRVGDSLMVLEAIGKNVHLTEVQEFVKRSSHKIFVGRLKNRYQDLVDKAVTIALGYRDIPYDDEFLYNNGKYYCSEMIYDAFKKANNNQPFFSLTPMSFKPRGKNYFYPAWISYYSELGMKIPEGKPGINPGGISLSEKIHIIN